MTTRIDTSRRDRNPISNERPAGDSAGSVQAERRTAQNPAALRASARAAREDRAARAEHGGAAPSDSTAKALANLLGARSAAAALPPASASHQDKRVDTAKRAIGALARELPGHRVDTDTLAARFGDQKYAAMSPGEIRSQATMSFVRAALGANPELADALIDLRLRALDGERRELVKLAVAASGARGLARYAAAESALGASGSLDRQETREVVAMLRTGMSLQSAMATQLREVAGVDSRAAATRSLDAQRSNAIEAARAQKAQLGHLLAVVNQAYQSVPVLSRAAEMVVGAGASLGTVGSVGAAEVESLIRQDVSPLRLAFDRAGNAGGYMFGELTHKIDQARNAYAQFQTRYAEYITVNQDYQNAIRNQDPAAIVSTSKRLAELVPQLKATAERLGAQAEAIARENKEFDGAAVHAAIHLAVSAVTLGVGGFPGEHAVQESIAEHVGRALTPRAGEFVGDVAATVYATTGEGSVVRGAAGAVHHE